MMLAGFAPLGDQAITHTCVVFVLVMTEVC